MESTEKRNHIDREEMLELTRRMTPERSCFQRIAGGYFDADGFLEDTFNVRFGNLKAAEKKKNLEIAKTIPFSATNIELVERRIPDSAMQPGGIWQLLMGILSCGMENDLLMESFYEQAGTLYRSADPFSIAIFHGVYDLPKKAADQAYLSDGEEVYDFLIGAFCPVSGDYDMGLPDFGFLFPAFRDRGAVVNAIDLYSRSALRRPDLEHLLTGAG